MEKERRTGLGRARIAVLAIAALFFIPSPAAPEETERVDEAADRITLDAARVMYDDESGAAQATGGAVMRYRDTVIRAERIDYDVSSQKAKASPAPGGTVSLQSNGRFIRGDSLEYDLVSEEGIMERARSELPIEEGTLYILGGALQVLPYDTAAERGLVKKKNTGIPDTSYVGL